jgi:hypothetical protein
VHRSVWKCLRCLYANCEACEGGGLLPEGFLLAAMVGGECFSGSPAGDSSGLGYFYLVLLGACVGVMIAGIRRWREPR